MACFLPHRDEEGFATPAAMLIALTLAVIATALVLRSVMALRLAQHDLREMQAEYALSGAQLTAAVEVTLQRTTTHYVWSLNDGQGDFSVDAEPEGAKASLKAAAVADDAFFQRLDVRDTAALRSRLAQASASTVNDVNALDEAAFWRKCASRFVSIYGGDLLPDLRTAPAAAPSAADRGAPRANEIWRIRVTGAGGWVDDRTVRLTGRPDHPVDVIFRKFGRAGEGGGPCEHLVGASLGG